jgi:hypothetical protein
MLDLNLEPNPFPVLCSIRSLVFAERLHFAIAPRLVSYLAHHLERATDSEIHDTQLEHYGSVRLPKAAADRWRRWLSEHMSRSPELPLHPKQRANPQLF